VKEYGDIPQVACYPGELNQVFMHLLTNAAQAIEGKGEITIRTFVEQESVHVQIADTGVGISPEQMQGLFDPVLPKRDRG
jgi:signal transduction histidine kinase